MLLVFSLDSLKNFGSNLIHLIPNLIIGILVKNKKSKLKQIDKELLVLSFKIEKSFTP